MPTSNKKLATRLNKLTEEFALRGIGSTFCSCPNSDGIIAKRIVAGRLFPEVNLIEDPVEVCDAHYPRPTRKPKGNGTEMFHRLFHRKELQIAEESQEISSFAQIFASLPLETRLERLGAIPGANVERQLKPSIFDRLDYQMQ